MLTRITLTNYGAYRGRHDFDVSCTDDRPLVLFGGGNGSGKTTIFESVMLCLFGAAALAGRPARKAAGKMLAGLVHRRPGAAGPAEPASVEVRFLLFQDGIEAEYSVRRRWEPDGSGERLEVARRDPSGEFTPLDDVGPPHWQEFIEGLIPSRIMRLFFFDGERTARIARDGTEDAAIGESFKLLLGLDMVEQLRVDLRLNLARGRSVDGAAVQADHDGLVAKLDESGQDTDRLKEELTTKQRDLEAVRNEVAAAEEAISGLGGSFAVRRAEAAAELAGAKRDHDACHRQILDMCSGTLPLSVARSRLERLRVTINQDEEAQRAAAGRELLDSKLDTLAATLGAASFADTAGLSGQDAAKAAALASGAIRGLRESGDPAAAPLGLSREQSSWMRQVIDEAVSEAPPCLEKYAAAASKAAGRVSRLEVELAAVPGDDEIGPLVSKAGRLNAKAGLIEGDIGRIEGKITNNAGRRARLNAKLNDTITKMYDMEAAERGMDLTRRVQDVLGEFAGKLKTGQIGLLERYVLEATISLMHKGIITGVRVDPETFSVSVHDAAGIRLPKNMLSEGEKQMLATAIMWALARMSGRPLPLVMDTPLARLDGNHRAAMVERFLPAASHQVLVFSTDMEIGGAEYEKLRPYLARSYVMEYSDRDGCTRTGPGYFPGMEGPDAGV